MGANGLSGRVVQDDASAARLGFSGLPCMRQDFNVLCGKRTHPAGFS
jgi:hypothetical protein